MFEPFPGNYVWNLSVSLAFALGGQIGEIDQANRQLLDVATGDADKGTERFFSVWNALGDRLYANGERDEAAGNKLSASAKFHRASVYYMVAERMQRHGFAGREAGYKRMLETMDRAVRTGGLKCERIEVPYESSFYPGLFMRAEGRDGRPAPCMIHTNGLDSVKEMLFWSGIGDHLVKRGVSMFAIDHPGVGEALRLRGLSGRHDSEAWISPAVDVLQNRSDIDPDRIGVVGWSLGGYYAPRAAAFEKRLALCVSWGANHLWGPLQEARLKREGENPVPHYWEHVMWVFGKNTLDEFMAWAPNMNLDGVVEKIEVPYLITHGAGDRQIPVEAAYRSYEQATSSRDRQLRIFTEEDGGIEHICTDNMEASKDFISDWVARQFGTL